jgi:hypothetical protein
LAHVLLRSVAIIAVLSVLAFISVTQMSVFRNAGGGK